MKKILITGATGFVGSNLVRHLSQSDYEIHVLVRSSSNLLVLPVADNIIIHHRTPGYLGLVEILIRTEIQCVVHLATMLLQAMDEAGCRCFINAASNAEFNVAGEACPNSFYASSKTAFRSILNYYKDCRHFAVINLVMYDNYGPADLRQKLVTLLLKQKLATESLKMSPGNQKINLVHVADTVRGIQHALDYILATDFIEAPWEICCLAVAESISLKELVHVFNLSQQCRLDIQWGALPYRDHELMEPWIGTIVPGWSPQVALRDGLAALTG